MLAEKAMMFNVRANELKEIMFNEFGAELFDTMNGEQFELIQKCFKLVDLSIEIVEEQAKTIQKIDEKLDKLLVK